MSDILSQEECDALLNAVSSTPWPKDKYADCDPPQFADLDHAQVQHLLDKNIAVKDRYAPQIDKETILLLQHLAQDTVDNINDTKLFGEDAETELVSVDELTIPKFLMSCSNPCAIKIFSLDNITEKGIFEINMTLLWASLKKASFSIWTDFGYASRYGCIARWPLSVVEG